MLPSNEISHNSISYNKDITEKIYFCHFKQKHISHSIVYPNNRQTLSLFSKVRQAIKLPSSQLQSTIKVDIERDGEEGEKTEK